jgi:hypothetical protein
MTRTGGGLSQVSCEGGGPVEQGLVAAQAGAVQRISGQQPGLDRGLGTRSENSALCLFVMEALLQGHEGVGKGLRGFLEVVGDKGSRANRLAGDLRPLQKTARAARAGVEHDPIQACYDRRA